MKVCKACASLVSTSLVLPQVIPPFFWYTETTGYSRKTFGLRSFPGMVFVINFRASYDDQIYVAILHADGTKSDFCRDSIHEFMRNVIPNG